MVLNVLLSLGCLILIYQTNQAESQTQQDVLKIKYALYYKLHVTTDVPFNDDNKKQDEAKISNFILSRLGTEIKKDKNNDE